MDGDGDSNGEGGEIGHADVEGADTEQFGALLRPAVEGDGRATAPQLYDLHFAPADAVQAGSQGFADGLFGGKTSSETLDFAAALANLNFGVDALEKALPMMGEDFTHAINFDDVDANGDIDALRHRERSGQSGDTPRDPKSQSGIASPGLRTRGVKSIGASVSSSICFPYIGCE